MDSFEEFVQGLNRMPENTRSSLIDSYNNKRIAEDGCSRPRFQRNFNSIDENSLPITRETLQSNYNDLENNDSQSTNLRQKIYDPTISILIPHQRNMSQAPLGRTFHKAPSNEIYDSSGRTFNLSSFRNHMDPDHLFDNDISSIHQPFNETFSRSSRRNATLNTPDFVRKEIQRNNYSFAAPNIYDGRGMYRKTHLMPYDDLGRTFNLSEFARSYSNVEEPSVQLNDVSGHNFKGSGQQSRTQTSCYREPCEFLRSVREPPLKSQFQCRQNTTYNVRPVTKTKMKFWNDNFVKDTYYPGIIVDSVNGLINFNKTAFDTVFDCGEIPVELDPEDVPISLLEAFDLRIQYEKELRGNLERRKCICLNEKKEKSKSSNIEPATTEGSDELEKEVPKDLKYWIHRDELKLASTIDIDLVTRMADIPETPLTEAINCLLKAEKMNYYDKNVHLAEEAIKQSSNGQHEMAALKSNCSFKLNLRKDETKTPTNSSYEPLAIISYIGTTKPIYNESK